MTAKKAKEDPRVTPLYEEIRSLYKISFHRSEDDEAWGSNVEGNVAHIYYQTTMNPGGALAHELLHVLVQHRGYRRLRTFASGIDQTGRFRRLADCLDNELQHHKMYPEFVKLGFTPSEFYHDGDVNTADYIESVLSQSPTDFLAILPDFLTLLAPGGSLSEVQRAEFEKRFMAFGDGCFEAQLMTVRSAVESWAQSESYDPKLTLRTILQTLQNPCYTWFGHSITNMNDGFFVDEPFEIEWQ